MLKDNNREYIINLVDRDSNLLEHEFLMLFFNLFGFSVFESSFERAFDILDYNSKNLSIINLVVIKTLDDIERFKSFENVLFILSHKGKKNRDEKIMVFPSIYNYETRDFELKIFLNELLDSILNLVKGLSDEIREQIKMLEIEQENIINMFLDFDLMDSWYILNYAPENNPKNNLARFQNLRCKIDNYDINSFSKNPYLFFAYLQVKLMYIQMCNKFGFSIKEISEELRNDMDNKILSYFPNHNKLSSLMGKIMLNMKFDCFSAESYLLHATKDRLNYYDLYELSKFYYRYKFDYNNIKSLCLSASLLNHRFYLPLYQIAKSNGKGKLLNEYEACGYYALTLDVLLEKFNSGYWHMEDLTYILESYASLSHYVNLVEDDSISEYIYEGITSIKNNAKNNAFLKELSHFVSKDGNEAEELLQRMYSAIDMNIEHFGAKSIELQNVLESYKLIKKKKELLVAKNITS